MSTHLIIGSSRAKLVYFSSDYIFDSQAGPYCEEEPANAIYEYGRQKLAAKHFMASHARDSLIEPIDRNKLGQEALPLLDAGMLVNKAVARLNVPLLSYQAGLKSLANEGFLDR